MKSLAPKGKVKGGKSVIKRKRCKAMAGAKSKAKAHKATSSKEAEVVEPVEGGEASLVEVEGEEIAKKEAEAARLRVFRATKGGSRDMLDEHPLFKKQVRAVAERANDGRRAR